MFYAHDQLSITPNNMDYDTCPLTSDGEVKHQGLKEDEGYSPWTMSDILSYYIFEKSNQALSCIYYLSKQGEGLLIWLCKRVPNPSEVLTTAPFTALMEMTLSAYFSDWYSQFGDNPNNKSFLRDMQKLVSTAFAWKSGAKQAWTDVKYDEGNICSQVVKSVCKLGVIKGGEFLYGSKFLENSGKWGNKFCEPTARIFSLLSQLRQKGNATDTAYLQYAKEHLTPSLVIQASLEASAKNFASDKAWKFIDYWGIEKSIAKLGESAQSLIMSGISGGNVDFISVKASAMASKIAVMEKTNDKISDLEMVVLYSTELIAKSLSTSVTTSIMVTTSKIAQDGMGIAFEYIKQSLVNVAHDGAKAEIIEQPVCPVPVINYYDSVYTNMTFIYDEHSHNLLISSLDMVNIETFGYGSINEF